MELSSSVSSSPPPNAQLNLPSTHTATSSPFVIAITQSGIKTLPSIINACLLTSAWSAASSDLYTSSRALYGLAVNGQAPKMFTKVNRYGLPWVAVCAGIAFSFLSFMSAGSGNAGEVFGWFADMTAVCGLLTWAGICYTYTRFYRAAKVQGVDRDTLPYKAPLQPYAAWYGLVFCSIILFFNGWQVFVTIGGAPFDKATFVTSYLPILFFPILYYGHLLYKGGKRIPIAEIDFYSGTRDIEEEDEPAPVGIIQKAWAAIM